MRHVKLFDSKGRTLLVVPESIGVISAHDHTAEGAPQSAMQINGVSYIMAGTPDDVAAAIDEAVNEADAPPARRARGKNETD